jgi:hypothetical protein
LTPPHGRRDGLGRERAAGVFSRDGVIRWEIVPNG